MANNVVYSCPMGPYSAKKITHSEKNTGVVVVHNSELVVLTGQA